MTETTTFFSIQLTNGTSTKSVNTPKSIAAPGISKGTCQSFLTSYQNAIDSTMTIKDAFYVDTTKRYIDLS